MQKFPKAASLPQIIPNTIIINRFYVSQMFFLQIDKFSSIDYLQISTMKS